MLDEASSSVKQVKMEKNRTKKRGLLESQKLLAKFEYGHRSFYHQLTIG